KRGCARCNNIPKTAAWTGRYRQCVVTGHHFRIKQYVTLPDFGKWVALLRKLHRDIRLCRKHALGYNRFSNFWNEAFFDQVGWNDWRGVELDRTEIIARSGTDGQNN